MEMEGPNREIESEWKEELKKREILMIDAVHHARELSTITMTLYSLVHILHGYEHHDVAYRTLLKEIAIVFIPLVNVDGFVYISDFYDEHKNWSYIRKNRNVQEEMQYCQDELQGVDLNRNYAFEFALDRMGSSPRPCEEDYRG
jgi:murein tripeptide amidase MpaA